MIQRFRSRFLSIDIYQHFLLRFFLIPPQCQFFFIKSFYSYQFLLHFDLTNPVFCSTDPHLSPKSFNSNSLTSFFDKNSEAATAIFAAATDFTYGIEVNGSKNSSPAV